MFKGQAIQEEVLGLTDLEHEDTTILQNVRYYTPINMASHPRRTESSARQL